MNRLIVKLVFAIFLIGNCYNARAKEAVDSVWYVYAKKAPQDLALVPLVNYLKNGAVNNHKVVETFFYWIAVNIKYDRELMLKQDRCIEDVAVDIVLTKRKTICAGYSNLFYEMCQLAKIECVVIEGFAQNMMDEDNGIPHAWNAVKLNNKWCLVDATWGSGGFGLGSDDYTAKLDMQYFLAEPKFMMIDHFPNDAKWQLLPKIISLNEFHNKYWDEMRMRKFNNLLDDLEYKRFKEIMKEDDNTSK